MKKTRGRRWLSLLLTLAMCLALAPAAWAADEYRITERPTDDILEPDQTATLKLMTGSGDTETQVSGVEWKSDNPDVASVDLRTGAVTGVSGGRVTISAYVSGKVVRTQTLTVRGIAPRDSFNFTINVADGSRSLDNAVELFGGLSRTSLEFTSRNTSIAVIDENNRIKGLQEGDVEIFASVSSALKTYRTSFTIHVEAPTINGGTITTNGTLSFKSLSFPTRLGDSDVSYVTGLYVSTSQGTLYYGYQSEAQPGAGVGQSQNYYLSPEAGQQALNDITFVPKSSYVGGSVTITYTAVTKDYLNYSCKIILTVQGVSDNNSSSVTDGISFTTAYNTAVRFDSQEFGAVCREKFGVQLDYVIFSQPPERQGTLYTNYSSAGNYGSVVDVHGQYSRKEIDDIWFVPAPGYGGGTVTVYYTGFATNGESYSGQAFIKVEQENITATGALSYSIFSGSMVRFDEDDFDDYCQTILDSGKSVSGIRFDSLPSESEGVLYYDYRSSANPGTPVTVGTVYYRDTRAPRIDRLVFVPATGFIGTIKLPFTGWTTDGTSFGGNVEVNVRGGVSSGDIYYYCAPGRSVSFRSSDFTNLSRTMTDYTLSYIIFRDLPAASEGYLYIGNSRISSTGAHYSTSDIGRMSFRASNSFSGLVIIPFEGYSRYGYPFTGVVTIGSGTTSNTTGTTSNTSNTTGATGTTTGSNLSTIDAMVQYSTRTAPVRFYPGDLAQNGSNLSSIRFTSLPSSNAGYLYYQYTSPTQYGQQVNTSTTYRVSGSNLISDLAFVPRAGYTGTVTIPYTGTNSSGTTFSGEVLVTVSPTYSSYYFSDMAGYGSAQIAAVDFLYDHSITHGLTADQYGPESAIRRGDFALMLYQAFEFFPVSSGTSFADVSPDAYYATAVNTLYARGIVSGTGGGYYAPDSTLTRQDAICMVQRAMRAISWSANDGYVSALAGYSDSASVSDYALGAMALAVQRGYLPTSGGLLNPRQPLTRVDMAELLHRALTY